MTKQKYYCGFAVLFWVTLVGLCSARANSPDWNTVHNLTLTGIKQLYSLNIDEAEQTFDSVARIAPTDPRGPFFQSIIHFYLWGLNREDKELTNFLNESERVIDICENILDRNPRDGMTKFYLGGIHGYRGMAHQTRGSYLKAAQDGRKGYILLEEAVSENPNLYDAHMGFGLFRYMVSKVPKSMQWILSVLGFDGDREGGLASLRLAAEKGLYTRTEAKLYLSQFMFSEGRRDTAIQYINELRRDYPDNTLFTVLYAFWQHRMDNYNEALSAAQSAMELNKRKKVRYGEELAYSTLGSIHFTLNDFQKSSDYYKLYMKMTPNDERTINYSFYRAAVACEIVGDRASAIDFCHRMRPPKNKDNAGEVYNYRRGQELLQRPFSEADVLHVRASNELSQKKYQRSIELNTQAVAAAGANDDIRSRALLAMQQAQFTLEQYSDAIETGQRLVLFKPVNESWTIPHAWFKLGQSYARLGKTAEARSAFEQVKEFDEFDFQERLEGQTEEEMKRLAK